MRILRYIFLSSLLLLLPFAASAQRAADKEKVPVDFSFKGVSLSADLFGFANSLLSEYTSGELAVKGNLGNRLYPAAEVGLGWCDALDEATGIKYKTSAPYYRVGVDYNFTTSAEEPDPKYYIFGLARFAWTGCEYDVVTPPITDPIWGGSASLDLKGVEGRAAWAEIGVGVRVQIARNFHMGWSVRYKARMNQAKGGHSEMWYIPGYGINKSTCFGGTYDLIYEIPFR